MGHPVFDGLLALGYTRLNRQDPRSYRDQGGQVHTTYQRASVRLAIAPQHSLCTLDNGAVLYCMAESEDCWLKAVLVDPDQQRRGLGTQAMQAITTLADEHGLTLYVEPVALGDLTHVHLIGWYARFGFRTQSKSWKVMVRQPTVEKEREREILAS
jgi:GNAT superfamily N-acetyltransferase